MSLSAKVDVLEMVSIDDLDVFCNGISRNCLVGLLSTFLQLLTAKDGPFDCVGSWLSSSMLPRLLLSSSASACLKIVAMTGLLSQGYQLRGKETSVMDDLNTRPLTVEENRCQMIFGKDREKRYDIVKKSWNVP